MKTIIKGRKYKVTDIQKKLIQDKLFNSIVKFIEPIDDPATIIEVTLEDINKPSLGADKLVHITLVIPHDKNPVHIDEIDKTFEEAINKAKDRLDKYFERHSTKHQHHL